MGIPFRVLLWFAFLILAGYMLVYEEYLAAVFAFIFAGELMDRTTVKLES